MLRTGATAGTPYSYTIYQVLTVNTKKSCLQAKTISISDCARYLKSNYTIPVTAGVCARLWVLQLRGGQHPGRERELRLPRDQPRPAPRPRPRPPAAARPQPPGVTYPRHTAARATHAVTRAVMTASRASRRGRSCTAAPSGTLKVRHLFC